MIRVAIIDQDGKVLSLKDVATATELVKLVEQARALIRDCERLAREKGPKSPASGAGQVPYLS
jgi:hypothetical protein